MRRRAAAVLMMGVLTGMVRGQETMVPDPRWEPSPGDAATVYSVPTPAARDLRTLRDYLKYRAAGDAVGMKTLVDRRLVALVAERASLLVIARHDFRPPPGPPRIYDSAAGLAEDAMVAGLAPPRPAEPNVLEVRFTSGPLRDEARLVLERDVARLIPAAPSMAPRARPRALPPATPEARAAGLLRAAEALEKAGRPAAALADYREVVAKYPGTDAARKAAGRIEALSAAPPPRP